MAKLQREALEREVLRINQRYLEEVVEAYSLCPWARRTRENGQLWRSVHWDPEELEAVHSTIESFVDKTQFEIGLLIFPTFAGEASEFRQLVGHMERAHAGAHGHGGTPLAMAAFHPQGRRDLSSPARLVPLLRCSPDPCIQLVRRQTLAEVRGSSDIGSVFAESLESLLAMEAQMPTRDRSQEIADRNYERVRSEPEAFDAVLKDIAADRRRSYQRLGLLATP